MIIVLMMMEILIIGRKSFKHQQPKDQEQQPICQRIVVEEKKTYLRL